MNEPLGLRGSVTVKILFIAFLALVLFVPMKMIESLIGERGTRMEAARSEIGQRWGNAQTIGAPMLLLPFRYTETVGDETRRVTDVLYVLPASLSIEGRIDPQILRRGIYEVPVYTATLELRGVLRAPELDVGAYPDLELLWSDAEIALPLSDARPLAEPVRLRLADAEAEFEAGGGAACLGAAPRPVAVAPGTPGTFLGPRAFAGGVASGPMSMPFVRPVVCGPSGNRLVVPYEALGLEPLTAMQSFAVSLTVRGTGQLHFLPLGDVTDVQLASSWPSPSFNGAFLPSERNVTSAGFTASWRVLALGRGYPSTWLRSESYEQTFAATSFGVDLIEPLGIHETSLRAAKYAVLFFGLTFLTYFLFEIFASLRLHALQYLAVGVANCLFFLLLLALAEHIGFGYAYVSSAVAATLLITTYSSAVLRAGRRALAVGGVLALVYAYLYVTLKAEDYALLIGSLGLFAVLAAFMILTRRVDWYAVSIARSRLDGAE